VMMVMMMMMMMTTGSLSIALSCPVKSTSCLSIPY
jgi:hypothetical protein